MGSTGTVDEAISLNLDYWKHKLAGSHNPDLPVDHRFGDGSAPAFATRTMVLPGDLASKLRELSLSSEATPHVLFLAAFQVLLMRHTGQRDLLVGTSSASLAGVSGPGMGAHAVAIRGDLSGNPRFIDLIPRVRDTVLAACAHDQPAGLLAGIPGLEAGLVARFDLHGDVADEVTQATDAGVTTIALSIVETASDLVTKIAYRTEVLRPQTIDRWLCRWQELLRSIAENPGAKIEDIKLLPATEQSLLLGEWCQTKTSTSRFTGIHQMVEAWASRSPDSIAVVHENSRLSYREFNARANQMAYWLRECGVGPDIGVGIYGDRSVATVTGILGVLKAGGFYVPLDVANPPARIQEMISDTSPQVILTQRKFAGALHGNIGIGQASVLTTDSPDFDLSRFPAKNPPSAGHAENLGYVMYTSGSTGRPKGVAMEHRALLRIVDWYVKETGISPGAGLLQFSSLGFDASFCEMFGGWHAGARVVLLPREESRQDPEALIELMKREQVEHLEAPYSGLLNIAHWAVGHSAVGELRLRAIVTGGEQLVITPELVRWLEQMPGCAVRNGYGPSETSVATSHWLRGEPGRWPRLPPIGRPITDAYVYLLDDRLKPAPIGVIGEVYVGGDIVARGYLNRPGLTAERFVADPFAAEPGRRLYRTGDLARFDGEGNLEFLGRADKQVKIRGYRIELGEIEACLQRAPAVANVAVAVEQDIPGSGLTAYLVPRDPAFPPTAEELRRHAGVELPDYMVPARYVPVESLPLTPSGKLDRARLRPVAGPATPAAEAEAEFSATATALLAIWQDVLAIPQIGVDDDFFDLGGHSLLATRIISKARSITGKRVLIGDIFECPTIAQLAARIDAMAVTGGLGQATAPR
jgi:amino acid adenylation domain-containing protein